MNAVLAVALDEWRAWYRSRLAVAGFAVFIVLVAGTGVVTASRTIAQKQHRLEQQTRANEHFATQPDRHPHRMVHYGHYVFRPPSPLSTFDPGIDAVTGESIFLEGHRQNTATFADARSGANVGGFGRLTPALLYQVFLPLLLIALGHGAIIRERESGTLATLLAQGTKGTTLVFGKALALLGLLFAFLMPAVVLVYFAVSGGESVLIGTGLLISYGVYLFVWANAVLLASVLCRDRGEALGVLLITWLTWTLILPPLGVATTSARLPTPSKIELDLQMQTELRSAGDGHNPADPAFKKLRARILKKFDVDRVEDLPINFRGVVAEASEETLTKVMNRYAESRLKLEADQARGLGTFGWLSPTVAVASASRILAATDLTTHHRFLREAEALRFEFVQRLNRIHAHKLTFSDDVQRSRDAAAERRTRVSAQNWSVLRAFSFDRKAPAERLASASLFWTMLAAWSGALVLALAMAARKLTP